MYVTPEHLIILALVAFIAGVLIGSQLMRPPQIFH